MSKRQRDLLADRKDGLDLKLIRGNRYLACVCDSSTRTRSRRPKSPASTLVSSTWLPTVMAGATRARRYAAECRGAGPDCNVAAPRPPNADFASFEFCAPSGHDGKTASLAGASATSNCDPTWRGSWSSSPRPRGSHKHRVPEIGSRGGYWGKHRARSGFLPCRTRS